MSKPHHTAGYTFIAGEDIPAGATVTVAIDGKLYVYDATLPDHKGVWHVIDTKEASDKVWNSAGSWWGPQDIKDIVWQGSDVGMSYKVKQPPKHCHDDMCENCSQGLAHNTIKITYKYPKKDYSEYQAMIDEYAKLYAEMYGKKK